MAAFDGTKAGAPLSGDPRVVYGFPAVMANANVGPRRRAPLLRGRTNATEEPVFNEANPYKYNIYSRSFIGGVRQLFCTVKAMRFGAHYRDFNHIIQALYPHVALRSTLRG